MLDGSPSPTHSRFPSLPAQLTCQMSLCSATLCSSLVITVKPESLTGFVSTWTLGRAWGRMWNEDGPSSRQEEPQYL